jgi:hypothetical protein
MLINNILKYHLFYRLEWKDFEKKENNFVEEGTIHNNSFNDELEFNQDFKLL